MKSTNSRRTIDIILCCYNQEQYVAESVESIISQKVDADVRVLVADDCSTDRTLEVIKSFEAKSPFPFVYLSDSKNLGLHANYKRAFAACQADYTAILEGDDWWSEDYHLSQHLNFLEHHKRFSMSFNNFIGYYQEENKYRYTYWPFGDTEYVTIKLRQQIAYGNQIGNLSTCMFRTKLLHALPEEFYKLQFADWELGIMMALHGPIGLVKGDTSTYRISDNGLWSAKPAESKYASQMETLRSVEPLLPSYCRRYIKKNIKLQQKGKTPFPMPLKYKVKTFLSVLRRHEKRLSRK